MTRIIHLSDPHFGTERAPVVAALQRMVREVAPTCLVLSGDITQRARPSQFRAARAFLDSLAVPHVLAIPGNHDISLFNPFKRLLAPYGDYRRWLHAELEPVIELPGALLIGVNTTRRYRHVNGEVSDAQIGAVARRLRMATPAQLRVVVVHQPAWVVRAEDEHNRLHRHERALRAWAGSGADLVLGGHIHLPYIAAVHHGLPQLARALWVVQAGTAVSSRVRAEANNSVNLIELAPGTPNGEYAMRRCTVSRWDYVPAQAAFAQVSSTTLELQAHALAPPMPAG